MEPRKVVRIPQHLLNIEAKTRCNLFPWRGQFSPQLLEVLLRAWGPSSGLVLDPFVGSGTVLVEAARLGLGAAGAEVNPAAAIMATTYELINKQPSLRRQLLGDLDSRLSPIVSVAELTGESLIRTLKSLRIDIEENVEENVELSRLWDSLIVTADVAAKPSAARLRATWARLQQTIMQLPYSDAPVRALLNDARRLPLADGTVDMVLTSPPYINVFNYHQQYRKSVELLGWDVLRAARSEIGSNRKHRQNRLLTVVQYCLDMAETLREVIRVCRPGVPIVLVVGRESNVRKTSFYNGELVSRIGRESLGLELVAQQERCFTNRFGQAIYEDILCFANTAVRAEGTDPRQVGIDALAAAFARAPEESLGDLQNAIADADKVRPSRVLEAVAAG